MNDQTLLKQIQSLVDQEHELFNKGELTDTEAGELRALEVKLDQLWDLMRQRRAKREYGQNPDEAEQRSASTVEGYTNTPYTKTRDDKS
jgi:Protein of unknown function (DUF2630)